MTRMQTRGNAPVWCQQRLDVKCGHGMLHVVRHSPPCDRHRLALVLARMCFCSDKRDSYSHAVHVVLPC